MPNQKSFLERNKEIILCSFVFFAIQDFKWLFDDDVIIQDKRIFY